MRSRGPWASIVAIAVCVAGAGGVRADVLQEAQELRRQMQYEPAKRKLEAALPDLQQENKARALILLSLLATDHKEARRLLHDATRVAGTDETRRRIDIELARLDYARGSYRAVEARMREHAAHADAALLRAQALVALGENEALRDVLQPARRQDVAQLLIGWGERRGGDTQRALGTFEGLAKQRQSDVLPTALLWKAECESQLGLRDRALQSGNDLRERFASSPEARLVETTLAGLQRGTPGVPAATESRPGRVVLQVGAFEDRANALRFQQGLAELVHDVQVEEIKSGSKRVFRVQVGPFETRERAEAFANEKLAPRGYTWQVVQPGEAGP